MGPAIKWIGFPQAKKRFNKKKKTPIDFSGRVTLAGYRRPYLKLPDIAFEPHLIRDEFQVRFPTRIHYKNIYA